MNVLNLKEIVWDYYSKHGRGLPWRQVEDHGSFDPYKILVSELMLQQTRVSRVVPKYREFLQRFPSVEDLANATLGDVLKAWQGLGYNRRAKFLWQAAQTIVSEYGGVFPADQKELTKLPGVGANTAGAICVYAFNQPAVFIETNIRTVYIHHFFEDKEEVDDKELLPIIEDTLDTEHSREWYWALMDYGSFLKSKVGNVSRRSKQYAKQSRFEGSKRQIRGAVLRMLVGQQIVNQKQLRDEIQDARLAAVLSDLLKEGLIVKKSTNYSLA